MLVRDEIEALRSDHASQRRAQQGLQQAVERWRSHGEIAAIECEMLRFSKGEMLTKLPLLANLFTVGNKTAKDLVNDLVKDLVGLLAENPLGHLPLRSSCDGTITRIALASVGSTALIVQAIDGNGLRRRQPAQTVRFAPCETWEHVLAGSGKGELVRLIRLRPGVAELERSDLSLSQGMVNFRDGASQSLLLGSVPENLVTLKLHRHFSTGTVACEYRVQDGTLVHQTASTSRDSRLELATALLGKMGRCDAAPLLAAMAEEQGGDSLRWQSLRECLGLDTALGFSTLCRIAARIDDPLAASAGALRAQLLEAYPQLVELARCHV